MPRSVSSQDGALNVNKGPSSQQQYLGAGGSIAAVSVPPNHSNLGAVVGKNSIASKVRNPSTKRLSDFGIFTNTTNDIAAKSTKAILPQFLRVDLNGGQKSPLLLSCSSSLATNTSLNTTLTEGGSLSDQSPGAIRPNTLPMTKTTQQKMLQPPPLQQNFLPVELSTGVASSSNAARKLSSTSGVAGKMPLSPLARQTSSSTTSTLNPAILQQQQFSTKITTTPLTMKTQQQLPNIYFSADKVDAQKMEENIVLRSKSSPTKGNFTLQFSK